MVAIGGIGSLAGLMEPALRDVRNTLNNYQVAQPDTLLVPQALEQQAMDIIGTVNVGEGSTGYIDVLQANSHLTDQNDWYLNDHMADGIRYATGVTPMEPPKKKITSFSNFLEEKYGTVEGA